LIAAPANPFTVLSPVPSDGPGPNPLLQNHVLMAVHPPMLYLGYVGMTVPFGMAIAALLNGKLSRPWLQSLRTFTIVPWTFLSIGILLGSLWAYEVLGWGGYWAWDPVENASFLPWLTATAFLHAAVVNARKQLLKTWALTLIVATFLLTILGTFMTRSGVFNSVHSFTQSSIGPVFLGYFAVVLVVSAGLLVSRAHLLQDEGQISSVVSRETAFMLNNLVLVIFTLTVLLGTVFPLINEAVRDVQISVGEPYYNRMAIPLGMMLVFLLGVGPLLPWGRRPANWYRELILPLGGAIAAAALSVAFKQQSILAIATLQKIIEPLTQNAAKHFRHLGGYFVHLAMILIVVAIVVSQTKRTSVEASLGRGESTTIGEYTLRYIQTEVKEDPYRFSVGASIDVWRGDTLVAHMLPKLNYYATQREPIGTPDVRTVRQTDIYLSLLSIDPKSKDQRVGIKIFLIPMAAWIWRSIPFLVLGSMLSLWPRKQKDNA
jgi:cytochrome c-type biogenesis protein CcmF